MYNCTKFLNYVGRGKHHPNSSSGTRKRRDWVILFWHLKLGATESINGILKRFEINMIPRELFLNYLKTTRMIRWQKPFPGRNLWITQKYLMWINALISNLNEYFKFTCLIGCKIKIVDRAIYLLTFQNNELNSHLTRMYIWNKQKSAKIRVTCKKFGRV